jgi:Na+(H+)/acetate symporter ActP
MISKVLLLVVALLAAWWRRRSRPTSCSWSRRRSRFAAAAFFPALVLGIFWKRANKWGAVAGHAGRPGHHLLLHGQHPPLAARRVRRHLAHRPVVGHPADLGAGVFGVPPAT